MKRRYTRGGRGREGRVVSSLFPHPLFFFHPVETVNGFLLGGGWLAATPPLRFEAIRPALFSLLSFRRFFFIRSRASSSLSPSLSSLHQNSTSTRNDCIVDTSNVSRTVDKTALLFLLSARPSFFTSLPFDFEDRSWVSFV